MRPTDTSRSVSRKTAFRCCPAVMGLVAILLGACQGPDASPTPSPSYSWRGQLTGSLTPGTPVVAIISIQESQQQTQAGLLPVTVRHPMPPGQFLIEYYLHGIDCRGGHDTALTLHLEFRDFSGQLIASPHQSDWPSVCDYDLPAGAVRPFPREDGLVVEVVHP